MQNVSKFNSVKNFPSLKANNRFSEFCCTFFLYLFTEHNNRRPHITNKTHHGQLLSVGPCPLGQTSPSPLKILAVHPIDFIKLSLVWPLLTMIKATAKSHAILLPQTSTRWPHQTGFSLSFLIFSHHGLLFFMAHASIPFDCLLWPSTFRTPTVPSIITMKLSTKPTKLCLIYKTPSGCQCDKLPY